MTAGCDAICAICYEDAKPIIEDLVSISLCGHVFHDICLQQWIEYTPRGRRATCPLCKHECTSRETHRLYFQSAADTEKCRILSGASSKSSPKAGRSLVDEAHVHKLEAQLTAAKAAVKSYQEQLKDLDCQLSEYILRVDKAEAGRAEAYRERTQCKDTLSRTQEELKKSMMERSMLLEKNIAMAKELAAHKLIADTDLAEEDVLRLASVGRGSNKEDIIDTLTKSLILRNRTYKDLMARCNELGLGESVALRKCEKAIEQAKRLKARVQELERKVEGQENARLRSLVRSNPSLGGEIASRPSLPQSEQTSAALCREKLTKITQLSAGLIFGSSEQAVSCGNLPQSDGNLIRQNLQRSYNMPDLLAQDAGHSSLGGSVDDGGIVTCAMASLGVNGQNEGGEGYMDNSNCGIYSASVVNPVSGTSQRSSQLDHKTNFLSDGRGASEDRSPRLIKSLPAGTDERTSKVDIRRGSFSSTSAQSPRSQGSGAQACENRGAWSATHSRAGSSSKNFNGDLSSNKASTASMNVELEEVEIVFPVPIRRKTPLSRVSPNDSGGTASSSIPSAMEESTGTRGSRFKDLCKFVHHEDATPSIPLDSKKIRSSGLNSVLHGGGNSNGRYIASGADGRGGRVIILKPSQMSSTQGPCSSMPTPSKPTRLKRSKLTDTGSNARQGHLQMEHFFERVASK